MSIQRIVVGTDFSEQAGVAVKQSMNIARHLGAEVVLVHSLPITQTQLNAAERSFGRPELFRELYRLGMQKVHDDLGEQHERLDGQGVEVSQLLTDAPEPEGICDAATELEADLVVVGSHGRGGIERLVLGSVSERVVRSYPGNVLVSRNVDGAGGFERIIIPADFSERTTRALETAKQLIMSGGTIDVVHTTALPPGLVQYYDEGGAGVVSVMQSMTEDAWKASERLLAEHRSNDYELVHHELSGPPKVVLPSYIEDSGASLAIIGSHGRRGVKRWLLGSVAEAIVRRSPSSVLVVH